MSDPRHPPETNRDLDPGDADLVRRIAESYRPAESTPSMRVAYRDRLDARIRRRAKRRLWLAGSAAAAVAAAAALVWLRVPIGAPFASGSPDRDQEIALEPEASSSDANEEDALLAFALPADSEEVALPADYEAIEDLILEGV
jgi:hypothetical protein